MQSIRNNLVKQKRQRLITYRIVGWTGVVLASGWYFRSYTISISIIIIGIVCCFKIPITPFIGPDEAHKKLFN